MAFAKGLAYPQHAARVVGFIKRSVTEGLEMPMYEGFALERELQNRLFAMADAKEGFRAFLEKRKPTFQGKRRSDRGRRTLGRGRRVAGMGRGEPRIRAARVADGDAHGGAWEVL